MKITLTKASHTPDKQRALPLSRRVITARRPTLRKLCQLLCITFTGLFSISLVSCASSSKNDASVIDISNQGTTLGQTTHNAAQNDENENDKDTNTTDTAPAAEDDQAQQKIVYLNLLQNHSTNKHTSQ